MSDLGPPCGPSTAGSFCIFRKRRCEAVCIVNFRNLQEERTRLRDLADAESKKLGLEVDSPDSGDR